jgi:hypothetical protein
MRILVLALALLIMPLAALAEDASAPGPSLSETAPPPHHKPPALSAGRKVAIALGALAGVVVTNVVTGGLITPVLGAGFLEAAPVAAAAGAAPPVAAGAAALAQTGVIAAEETYLAGIGRIALTAVGAVIGGEVGNWFARD